MGNNILTKKRTMERSLMIPMNLQKIENIINENANLNDINNQMREKNLEFSSYKNTFAEVDDNLAIVRDESHRTSQMNVLMDDKNSELRSNLKPFEGRKLP